MLGMEYMRQDKGNAGGVIINVASVAGEKSLTLNAPQLCLATATHNFKLVRIIHLCNNLIQNTCKYWCLKRRLKVLMYLWIGRETYVIFVKMTFEYMAF